jgi:hypothetical protein
VVLWWEAAVAKRYRVTLTGEEREALGHMISRGKAAARRLVHARVLLQADASEGGPDWTDTRIAEAVRVSVRTIGRVRQRFVEEGLEAALQPKPSRRVYARKLDGAQEAKLELLAEVGDGLKGRRRRIVGVFAPPLLQQRSDTPCLMLPSSSCFNQGRLLTR